MTRWATLAIGFLAFCSCSLTGPAQAQSGEGWITLFDGKSLDHWQGDGNANFAIEDGSIVAKDKKDPKANDGDYGQGPRSFHHVRRQENRERPQRRAYRRTSGAAIRRGRGQVPQGRYQAVVIASANCLLASPLAAEVGACTPASWSAVASSIRHGASRCQYHSQASQQCLLLRLRPHQRSSACGQGPSGHHNGKVGGMRRDQPPPGDSNGPYTSEQLHAMNDAFVAAVERAFAGAGEAHSGWDDRFRPVALDDAALGAAIARSRARQQRKMRDGYFVTSAPALATWPS